MIKLFIFDLDGVLTSTSIEHFAAWKTIIKKRFNITLSDSIEELTKGVSRMDSLNVILESCGLENEITNEEKKQIAIQKNELYKSLISEFNFNNLYSGVINLFQYLKSKNILIALGSASINGPSIIDALGITSYFDYVVNPKELRSKPSPDIFNKAKEHFNLLPHECVGVEDAISGVTSIKKACMYAIGIGDVNQLHHADIVFDTIAELDYQFLEKLIEGDYGKT